MTTHDLKVHPPYFAALADGTKTFEARKDDRDPLYAVGDVLRLREWDPAVYGSLFSQLDTGVAADAAHEKATDAAYTGRVIERRVSYVLRGGPWLTEGYVVLGLARDDEATTEALRLALQELVYLHDETPDDYADRIVQAWDAARSALAAAPMGRYVKEGA